jgi:hypothetical protein
VYREPRRRHGYLHTYGPVDLSRLARVSNGLLSRPSTGLPNVDVTLAGTDLEDRKCGRTSCRLGVPSEAVIRRPPALRYE